MAALLSCFMRSDDPSLPLTFPKNRIRRSSAADGRAAFLSRALTSVINTASDLWFSFSKTNFSEDDLSPLRSGDPAVGSRPISVVTLTFSLDDVKAMKDHLGVTVNDVITGTIFLGTRLYMQEKDPGSEDAEITGLVLMNTRMLRSYNSIKEMGKLKTTSPWGNNFAFVHVTVPKLTAISDENNDQSRMRQCALEFVRAAGAIIKKKRVSLAIPVTAKLLELYRKMKGHEDLSISVISYMGQLRVSVGAEKGFIDHDKLKSSIQMAFHHLRNSACH
ncbi:unnamed protein product [Linum tenue]|uniref:O-acyltransferase WSD1 C-terminal domain-containing protein n=1 Tax=Linum tenue TaxID=586396 RepID=A0AAV0MS37_9ROSI|nr:unnamed protein product [Linum tenue]